MHEDICTSCRNVLEKDEQFGKGLNEDEFKHEYMEKLRIPYCESCNMPIWDVDEEEKCNVCGSHIERYYGDVVPVFIEEKLLLSVIFNEEIYKKTVWCIGHNRYLIDNESIGLSINDIDSIQDIREGYYKLLKNVNMEVLLQQENMLLCKFVSGNKKRFEELELEGHKYVKKVYKDYEDRISFVSFSGGKDSIVVSDIVRQALSKNDILHVFSDTTLEMAETLNFVEEFKKENPRIPFIEAESPKDFFEMSKEIGPPTRMQTWCCSVFKSGPISQMLNIITYYKNPKKPKHFLTFYGIRAEESASRNKYSRTSNSPKITSQTVVSPIFGWLDYDIWLYILSRELKYNPVYRLGYRRVGCWCCPNNSGWSEFLNNIYYNEMQSQWTNFLYSFAQKIGKEDYKTYVDEGYWKARHGGIGIDNKHTRIDNTPCIDKEYENYIMQKSYTDSFDEYLKPFGTIKKEVHENYIKLYIYKGKSNKRLFKMETMYGSSIIKLKIYETRNVYLLKQRIECQLRKYQLCMHCSACDSVCERGAISTMNNVYSVDSTKCNHCLKCIANFTGGCIVNESLVQKEEEDE